jgi:hypothetical protein
MSKTAEEFLRDKIESEIADFGDGTKEFHTRDIEHLCHCLDSKDARIKELEEQINAESTVSYGYKRQIEELEARLEGAIYILRETHEFFDMEDAQYTTTELQALIDAFLTNKTE